MQAAASRLLRGQVKKRPALSSWSAVLDYCRTAQAFADREQFRVLFLDKRNQLIADEVQQVGTVDHTPVYPREVVKRALELSATAIILVHNHPSGDPTPSRADIQMTQQIIAVASPLGISVHDHIIVGKDGHASLKGLKLIRQDECGAGCAGTSAGLDMRPMARVRAMSPTVRRCSSAPFRRSDAASYAADSFAKNLLCIARRTVARPRHIPVGRTRISFAS